MQADDTDKQKDSLKEYIFSKKRYGNVSYYHRGTE